MINKIKILWKRDPINFIQGTIALLTAAVFFGASVFFRFTKNDLFNYKILYSNICLICGFLALFIGLLCAANLILRTKSLEREER